MSPLAVNTPTRLSTTLEEDQIESFNVDGVLNVAEDIIVTQETRAVSRTAQSVENLVDNGLNCECGVSVIRRRAFSPIASSYFWCRSRMSAPTAKVVAVIGIIFGMTRS
jgi:hypothetical protein